MVRDYRWGHLQDDEGREISPSNTSFEDYVETIRRRFIIRGVEVFIEEVEKYRRELRVNYFIFRVYFPSMSHEKVRSAIKMIGEKVIPYFQQG